MMLSTKAQIKWGHLPFLQNKTNKEWSAACPVCGGDVHRNGERPDRFRIFTDGEERAWCRRCGHFEWADSEPPTQQQLQKVNQYRVELAHREEKRLKYLIDDLQLRAYWRGYHNNMSQLLKDYWTAEGFNEYLIDKYQLGGMDAYHIGEFQTPAATIPYWGRDWEVTNLQYRLLKPIKKNDKYRKVPGLPLGIFYADADIETGGQVLVVEGAKKAMITWLALGHAYNVVALPNASPGVTVLDALSDLFEQVLLGLDPDTCIPNNKGEIPAHTVASHIGLARTKLVYWPEKPDELVVSYNLDSADMASIVRDASFIQA